MKIKPGTPRRLDDQDNPSFDEWMSRINRLIEHFHGLSVYDLPDCNYKDWYVSRLRPVWAAQRAIKNAGI